VTTYFQDKTFLITGGASGIGLATARLLKQNGARIAIWDVNAEALKNVEQELGALTALVDITKPEQVRSATQGIIEKFGKLDGVVHCAGIMKTGLFDTIPLEAHRRIIEVNSIGTVNVAYTVLPFLKQTRGSLVMMGSSSAFYGAPEYASYGLTKSGVMNLGQALRLELEGTGVYVGVCNPMYVGTPTFNEENKNARLFKRQGVTNTPEEVARVILNGIEHRSFLIFPEWRSRNLFRFTRYLNFLTHSFIRLNWR
jgi:short-subunit dehydrogenase